MRRLVREGYDRARQILVAQTDNLRMLAEALLEWEVLSGEEVDAVMEGRAIERPDAPEPASPADRAKEKDRRERVRGGLFARPPVLKQDPEKA